MNIEQGTSDYTNTKRTRSNERLLFFTFWIVYFFYEWLTIPAWNLSYRYFAIASLFTSTSFLTAFLIIKVLLRKTNVNLKKSYFWLTVSVVLIVFVVLRRIIFFYFTLPSYVSETNFVILIFVPKIVIDLIISLYCIFYFIINIKTGKKN